MESRDEFSDRNLLSQVELNRPVLFFFFFYRFEDHWWENREELENRGNSRRRIALVEITRIKFECNENIYVLFIGKWAVAVSRVCSFI